jgi:hypothetical protein
MKSTVLFLLTSLFAATSFAQAVNPGQIADQFIICSSQSQTQQLMIPMSDATTPVMGQYIVTDAPGSQNVLEMVQLDVTKASFDAQAIVVEATGIIDFNKTFDITANAVGEFNITPALKTTVYLGSLNRAGAAAEGFTCVVLTADELSQMAPN